MEKHGPTATRAPEWQHGRWQLAPQLLNSSTSQLQISRNKARMSMKTKDTIIKSSTALVAARERTLLLMSPKSRKGIHRVAGGNAPGMWQRALPTLKGSNGTFLRPRVPDSAIVRPFQGRSASGS